MFLQSVESRFLFSPEVQDRIKTVITRSYNQQFKVLIAFAAAQIPSSFFMRQKEQILVYWQNSVVYNRDKYLVRPIILRRHELS
jgi:hypothetical protein